MPELWEKFIFEFCKVGFLCWQGEPNWLGWILIGISSVVIFVVIAGIIIISLDRLFAWYDS